jgi:hypothetical protein
MKNLRLLLLMLGATGAISRAAPTVSATLTFANAYIFRGVQFGHEAFQPDVTVTNGAFSGGVWANLPTASGEKDEVDPHFAYSFQQGGTSWQTGVQVYTYPQASGGETRYSVEPFVSASLPLGKDSPVTAYGVVAYDVRLRSISVEGDLSRTFSLPTGDFAVDLTPTVFLGYVAGNNLTPDAGGPNYKDGYRYWGLRTEAAHAFSKQFTLSLGGQWDGASNLNGGDAITGNLWWYAAARLSW